METAIRQENTEWHEWRSFNSDRMKSGFMKAALRKRGVAKHTFMIQHPLLTSHAESGCT